MVIFHSYVELPEGKWEDHGDMIGIFIYIHGILDVMPKNRLT